MIYTKKTAFDKDTGLRKRRSNVAEEVIQCTPPNGSIYPPINWDDKPLWAAATNLKVKQALLYVS